jgi:hypothetical protein
MKAAFPAVLALAAIVLLRGPYLASDMAYTPDCAEYALGARRIAAEGRFGFTLGGKDFPSRYPPGFSILLSPAYAIGRDIGSGILVVTLLALLGVASAWFIGLRLGGPWGALLSALSLLALPDYLRFSGHIMTDVPCCALTLSAGALYLSKRRKTPWAGTLAASCAALRPASLAAALPFIEKGMGPRRAAALGLPMLLLGLATALYNLKTFGSPLRNGYNFWCPVPYDYPALVFSLSYLPACAKALFWKGGLGPLLGACAFLMIRPGKGPDPEAPRRLVRFTALAAGPQVALHLFYFFPSSRFALPASALLAVLCAGLAGRRLWRLPARAVLPTALALAAAASAHRALADSPLPHRRMRADDLARCAPGRALIVSGGNPAYLEALLGPNVIPFSRASEYASKLVAWKKVQSPLPKPASPFDHRCPGLAAGGALEAVPWVAVENPGAISREMSRGRTVLLDEASLLPGERALLGKFLARFAPIPWPGVPGLYRLVDRP